MEVVKGRIIKGIGGFYYVDSGDRVYECRARGKFRKLGLKPCVGDWCEVQVVDETHGYLQELLPRKNELIRPHVCNLDALVIVVSQAPPVTDLFLIDRVSAIAVHYGMEVIICINKCDLSSGEDLAQLYESVGFRVVCVSGKTGEGVDLLKEAIAGKLSAFTGNSGVGKSTVINAISPALNLETGDINEKIGRGRHTTRHSELFRISHNTWIADTPGFSAFDTERMELITPEDLKHGFPEMERFEGMCAYQDCAHVKDRGCAVLQAVENGEIAKSRHDSYVKLYQSMKEIKSWERKESR
ncbi:MAG: ribosome small subunit-dependent GTPase A [Ruminococcaceae bacterium]|nr:ribosome small subunit-dependent GTPase A [Oscillospiraceae bacterium]